MTTLLYKPYKNGVRIYVNNVYGHATQVGYLDYSSDKAMIKEELKRISFDLKVPYSAQDIFRPSGELRYVNIRKDGTGRYQWYVTLPSKKAFAITYNGVTRDADIAYLAIRIMNHYGVKSNSITAVLIKSSLTELTKAKVLSVGSKKTTPQQ